MFAPDGAAQAGCPVPLLEVVANRRRKYARCAGRPAVGLVRVQARLVVLKEGAILALREAALRVPRDVSVVGFDDVLAASINNPPLTTIHQPLRSMGQVAAATLLGLIQGAIPGPRPTTITVYPKLMVRKSTAHVAPRAAGASN
jgi:LacI family transcriptional regulator